MVLRAVNLPHLLSPSGKLSPSKDVLDCFSSFVVQIFEPVFRELCPKLVEFFVIFVDIVGAVDHHEVFLIVTAGLVGPVEGAGDHES